MDDRIRASDADRDRVTARLRDHYAEGRLSRDELDERIAAALSAKTFGELRRVLADLPEPRPVVPQRVPLTPAGTGWPYPVLRHRPRLFPLIAIVLFALLLVHGTGPAAIFFDVVLSVVALMFVLTMTAATFFRHAFRHHGRNWRY